MYVLTLGGVHKNQIIGSGQLGEHILRVTEDEIYAVAHSRCLKVLSGRLNSLFIILNCRDMRIRVLTHKNGGKSDSAAHLEYFLRLHCREQDPKDALRFPAYDWHIRSHSLLLKTVQKIRITRIHGGQKNMHSLYSIHSSPESARRSSFPVTLQGRFR